MCVCGGYGLERERERESKHSGTGPWTTCEEGGRWKRYFTVTAPCVMSERVSKVIPARYRPTKIGPFRHGLPTRGLFRRGRFRSVVFRNAPGKMCFSTFKKVRMSLFPETKTKFTSRILRRRSGFASKRISYYFYCVRSCVFRPFSTTTVVVRRRNRALKTYVLTRFEKMFIIFRPGRLWNRHRFVSDPRSTVFIIKFAYFVKLFFFLLSKSSYKYMFEAFEVVVFEMNLLIKLWNSR